MASARFNVPAEIFAPVQEGKPPEPSPLEKLLGRTRDENGKLVPKQKPRRSKTVAATTFNRTKLETQAMVDSCDWTGCASRHLVALYDLMHEITYGIAPVMSSQERYLATVQTGPFVKRAFDGDFLEAVAFFRWAWTREKKREKWREENGHADRPRLGWRFMLSNSLLSDYKVEKHRESRLRTPR